MVFTYYVVREGMSIVVRHVANKHLEVKPVEDVVFRAPSITELRDRVWMHQTYSSSFNGEVDWSAVVSEM